MGDRRKSLLRRDDIPLAGRVVAMVLFDAENEHGVISEMSQEDIADAVGIRRQYAAKMLADLRDKGVIAFDHGRHHPGVYRFVGEYAPEGALA